MSSKIESPHAAKQRGRAEDIKNQNTSRHPREQLLCVCLKPQLAERILNIASREGVEPEAWIILSVLHAVNQEEEGYHDAS